MLTLFHKTRRAARHFKSNEQGSQTVEFVIVVPLLVWAVLAMIVFWDGFQTANANQRSAYLIADLISREVDEIDTAYLNGVSDVARTLNSDPATELRVTIVNRTLNDSLEPIHEIDWSWSTPTLLPHEDVEFIEDRLPMMAVGDQLIYVEAMRQWNPAFPVANLDPRRFEYVAVTIPRFAPQIVRADEES